MYNLVNVPHKNDRAEIDSRVDGQTVMIVAVDRNFRAENKPFGELRMDDLYIGDHMLENPQALREMIGRAMVHAIIRARDIGYAQAQADIRKAIGAK
jgi:hypothetical protein